MVTRVESRNTDLLHCDIYVGPHNGMYTKYYDNSRDTITGTYTKYIDHSRDTNTTNKFSGLEHYAWFYVWCFPVSIGSAVKIKYTYNHTLFESSFYAILSLCEVEVYGRVRPCASNASHGEYIPPCMSNPCDNGGSCMENDTSYTCLCPAAWTGINCEQKKEEKKLSTTTKLLIGGGVVAVGAGSAVAAAACCSSISCSDVVTKCLGVVALKTIRQRMAENAAASLDYDEEDEDEEEEDEEYSMWDEVYRSFTSLVYGEENVSDAVNASASEQQCA